MGVGILLLAATQAPDVRCWTTDTCDMHEIATLCRIPASGASGRVRRKGLVVAKRKRYAQDLSRINRPSLARRHLSGVTEAGQMLPPELVASGASIVAGADECVRIQLGRGWCAGKAFAWSTQSLPSIGFIHAADGRSTGSEGQSVSWING